MRGNGGVGDARKTPRNVAHLQPANRARAKTHMRSHSGIWHVSTVAAPAMMAAGTQSMAKTCGAVRLQTISEHLQKRLRCRASQLYPKRPVSRNPGSARRAPIGQSHQTERQSRARASALLKRRPERVKTCMRVANADSSTRNRAAVPGFCSGRQQKPRDSKRRRTRLIMPTQIEQSES